MPKSFSLFKSSSCRRKLGEKTKTNKRKSWRITYARTFIIFTVFSLLASVHGSVVANCSLPASPQNIVIEETCISKFFTTPASTIFINVTEYDAQQIVKNITVEFREPVAYVSFILNVLSDKPAYVKALNNATVLHYYTIEFLTELAGKITNVTMFFVIEKVATQKINGNETLILYRYDRGKIEECPTKKVEEDDIFSYFKTKTEGASYVAVTGVIKSAPWGFGLVALPVVVIVIVAVIAIAVNLYRRSKLANLRTLVKP